jgi:hypothetical protein
MGMMTNEREKTTMMTRKKMRVRREAGNVSVRTRLDQMESEEHHWLVGYQIELPPTIIQIIPLSFHLQVGEQGKDS